MNLLTDAIRQDGEYGQLLAAVKRAFRDKPLPLLANGLCEGASDAFITSLLQDTGSLSPSPAISVCAEEKECLRTKDMLELFGMTAAFYPVRDLTFYNISASHEYEHARIRVLSGILSGAFDVVITTPDAMLGYTIPPERLEDATLSLDFDTRIDPDDLSRRLTEAGYARVDMVDGAGQFARRGGILDIYPPMGTFVDEDGNTTDASQPLRIELFDDEIDRMVIFDIDSQRTVTSITSVTLPPAREILCDADAHAALTKAIKDKLRTCRDDDARGALSAELASLGTDAKSGVADLHFIDKYVSLIYPERTALVDYFTRKPLILVRSTSAVHDRLKAAVWQMNQTVTELMEAGTIASTYAEYQKPQAAFEQFLDAGVTVHVDSLSYGMSGKRLGGIFGFRTRHMVSYAENFQLLCEDLTGYMRGGYRTAVMTENETAAKNLAEMLSEQGFDTVVESAKSPLSAAHLRKDEVTIVWRSFLFGYELFTPRIALLSTNPDGKTATLSVQRGHSRKKKQREGTAAILSYADLTEGDYVVHETHGIGIYTGIETLSTSGAKRDYIGIKYAGADKLYIPVEKLDMVSKYIGARAEDGTVKLSKFGTDGWQKSKARAKAAVKDMAKELIQLYAQRMRIKGHAFPPDEDFQRDFEAAFAYSETDSQLDAAEDIKRDMEKPVPMDRLLCGDVGYGKTEVAFRAAYKAIMGGKQVALLVPTTILALQHFQTATARMRAFGVNIDMVSRFRTPKQQEQILRRLERGDLDMIIGTHRLLGKDVKFKDLGLLIVDEEQRFGVAQKEKLKQITGNVDVLSLSATPIPRTLNMAMGGIRDISVLDQAPGNRLPVQTYVLEHEPLIILEAIRKELRRGGQVFYLHNFVESIDKVAADLAKQLPDARITVAHGKMDKDTLEDIWEGMIRGDIDILVSTTIIETGVDVPNANTLIVDNAHRLGLSQLHQLRGRIGRSARRAYAYFTYPVGRALPEIAQKRLEAIRDYAEFGAGFKIALRDMEIRGAGNLLGAEQHGHLDAVGYDMYIKLLKNAVLEEKGEVIEQKPECTVSLDYDAYLPETYVRTPGQRMALYKRIALIETEYDRDDIADELLDRYGDLPVQAENLLYVALIRAEGAACDIRQIRQDGSTVAIYPGKFRYEVWADLSRMLGGRLKMVLSGEPHMVLRLKEKENALRLIHKMFVKYTELSKQSED